MGLFRRPWSQPPRPVWIPTATASADVTVALTGSAATASAGTLAPANALQLSGASATSAQGSVAPSLTLALSGVAVTVSAGTLTPATAITLIGASLTGSQGSVSVGNDVIVALSGQSATATAGSLIPANAVALSGIQITSAQGSVSVSGSNIAVAASDPASGGWLFLNQYNAELARRRAREKRRKELEEESEQIEDSITRDIALLLREQEAIDDRKKEVARVAQLARELADLEAARQYSERVATAYERVLRQDNYSAIAALERELKRAGEEEEFLLMALMLLVD